MRKHRRQTANELQEEITMMPHEQEAVMQQAAAAGPALHAVDQSDLSGLISAAHHRADESVILADRLDALVRGLAGEDTGGQVGGSPVAPSPCGLNNLSDALDRANVAQNRANGLIDRLNNLVAIGG